MHLQGRIGGYRVLIPATSVLDVWTREIGSEEAPTWRGRAIPYVDGRRLLGEEPRAAAATLVAYGERIDDPKLAILGLDEVLGSVEIASERLKPFPPSLADAHRLFDGIATLPDDPTSLLRFRAGLDLAGHAEIRIQIPTSA
jgi:hypothetical protein